MLPVSRAVDTDNDGTFEYELHTLEELLLHLGDSVMTAELKNDHAEVYNTKLEEIKAVLFRHNGLHAGGGFFLKEEFVPWFGPGRPGAVKRSSRFPM